MQSTSNNVIKKRLRTAFILFLILLIVSACLPHTAKHSSPSNNMRMSAVGDTYASEKTAVKSSIGIKTLSDFKELRLSLIAGTVFVETAEKYFPDAKYSYLNSTSDQALAIIRGDVDAMLVNQVVAADIAKEHTELFVLPEAVDVYHASFTTPKTKIGMALAEEFGAFVKPLSQIGELDRMLDKWKDKDSSPALPKVKYGDKKIVISVSADDFPFSYKTADGFLGYNIELLDMFCEECGYNPVYTACELTAALAGLQTGTYDMLGWQLIESQERAEMMNFSFPLVEGEIVAIVRKADVAPELLAASDDTAAKKDSKSSFDTFLAGLKSSFEKNFIREGRWKMLLRGLMVTVELSAFSAILGTLLGALVCFLRLRKNKLCKGFAAAYVKIFQGTPIVVLLLVLYYVIFGSTDMTAFAVCVLGFSLDFSAYVSEMIRSGIESVPAGQKRAALALGYGNIRAFNEIILPQATRRILPVYRGQLVAMVKMTSIAGYISVEDLTKVSDIIRSRTYDAFFPLICTALIYFLLANLLTSILKLIQFRTDPINRKRLPKGVK